mmetsp:Transcript_12741/g.16631  ORF Transcript_12741/g.16631 Transcript_12741/m.16631 type:complete len:372 (+) Transcript_12741:116-1231(+)|eukprot:CAMPEP_0116068168 /NCGR_PEP_ID=MMETSP0322-20121206/11495_1 /TAXON_ID=163516 /ORGANISM="Leptocylindrus danicus var. apora, Strain B651" /LENGTH=371 /DNA_ID=CAMNT_0003555217 /DNA_START=49 /DNA_END=1164 /DNA_ORIENTATION=-
MVGREFRSLAYYDCRLSTPPRFPTERKASSCSWNIAGMRLASGHIDRMGRIWSVDSAIGAFESSHSDSASCREISSVVGHNGPINCIRWSSKDSSLLSTVAPDKSIRFWDIRVGSSGPFTPTSVSTNSVRCVDKIDVNTSAKYIEWNDNGKVLLATDLDNYVHLYDCRKNNQRKKEDAISSFTIPEGYTVDSCSFTPCGKHIVAGVHNTQRKDGILLFYNLNSAEEPVYSITAHTAPIRSIQFSACSTYFATSSDDGLLGVFNSKSMFCSKMISRLSSVKSAGFSFDCKLLASCGPNDSIIDVSNPITGEKVGSIQSSCGAEELCWHPSLNCVAYAVGEFKPPNFDGDERDRRQARLPPIPAPVTVAKVAV